jgi:hypothetical protein
MSQLAQFIQQVNISLASGTFVKITLANYKGTIDALKNIQIKKVRIKNVDKLSFTFKYQTRDIVKNIDVNEGVEQLNELLGIDGFRVSTLFTTVADYICEWMPSGKSVLRKQNPTQKSLPSLEHNIAKHRLIQSIGKTYLHQLKITDETGEVYKNAQDKYKQINHYIELLHPLLANLPVKETIQIVDMGAGKGYLTFALYDYITNELKRPVVVKGVEYRKELVDLCNTIAQQSNFTGLSFVQGSITDYDATHTNVLIALHACDTATDDAIQKGIDAGADLIVVAPCCHKQIRREITTYKVSNDLDFLTKHGIFMERQAEMVTDGLRSLIMEYHGYATKVFQFVSDVHTPKNIMIVGEKKPKTDAQKQVLLNNIHSTKAYFGIKQHYLETVLGMK